MTKVEALNIVRPLPLTVDDFLLLDKNGAFDGYGKTELIGGEIYYMNAQHRPHARMKGLLYQDLSNQLRTIGSELTALTEVTIAIPPHSAPEPDIVLTSEPDGEGPVPLASVALIVEVADTTLEYDLGPKALLYAQNGIPEYWVVDVQNKLIILHSKPVRSMYSAIQTHEFAADIEAITITGLVIKTDNLER
jgi:Uma2 family endonuclease